MRLFVEIVEAASLSEAASALGISRSTVTRQLDEPESHLVLVRPDSRATSWGLGASLARTPGDCATRRAEPRAVAFRGGIEPHRARGLSVQAVWATAVKFLALCGSSTTCGPGKPKTTTTNSRLSSESTSHPPTVQQPDNAAPRPLRGTCPGCPRPAA